MYAYKWTSLNLLSKLIDTCALVQFYFYQLIFYMQETDPNQCHLFISYTDWLMPNQFQDFISIKLIQVGWLSLTKEQ